MTSFQSNKSELVTSKDQLIAVLSGGSKPKDQWRLGTEHEKFSYRSSDFSPLPYGGPNGIQALLNGLRRFGWQGVYEGENIIALSQKDKGSVSLEPGGQVELSGAPLDNVHQTCTEVTDHLKHVKTVGDELGIGMLGLGFTPNWRRDDIHWMPKGRYKIMREYMPKVGSMGIDMMTRTCTVQINLDYSSEADMVKKLRVSLALQPLATALWANSPFTESKPNGFLSFRGNIWRDTDKARTGLIPFAFEDGMGFERYVDYILDVPMYFVYRDGFIDASGQSFRDFLKGKLPAYPGQLPTVADWEDHMSTAFPDVRVKSYIELRGADSGPWDSLCALPAFWVGLLYDSVALDATADIVKDWTAEDRAKLRDDVLTLALKAKIHGRSLQEIALQLLELSRAGLRRRARLDAAGMDETGFLVPLQEIASSGITPAERMLASYHGSWKGDVTKAYAEYSY
ncbi:MAG: glutamate--cysteine ligase [Alphaproteobacteria bacterium]|nr:glutamate--cysteine ligase [Alphaproteobacteria bacterium]PHX99907.1 MAG: glutamate--cysteine ligase [Rhodospirillaceae bacterium]